MDCKFKTELGLVTVNDEVLVRVAGYAALDCYGIVGMASKRSTDGIVQLMGRENLGRGVKVRQNGEKVDIDLFIIVASTSVWRTSAFDASRVPEVEVCISCRRQK